MSSVSPRDSTRDAAIEDLSRKTIRDFGEQWKAYESNDGYHATKSLLGDIFGPLLNLSDLVGKRVAEIGAGTGRVVRMLLDAGAQHVLAIEPSDGFPAMQRNLASAGERVTCLRASGEEISADAALDYVFSIGVIQFIPDPAPVIRAALASLKPGGKLLIWIYSHEGNEPYLLFVRPLRAITTRLPHWALASLCWLLLIPLGIYMGACKILPLPLRNYFRGHLSKLSWRKIALTIYDQLNPTYAKYYREAEARALLEENGFSGVQLYHRHKYSWSVIGTRR